MLQIPGFRVIFTDCIFRLSIVRGIELAAIYGSIIRSFAVIVAVFALGFIGDALFIVQHISVIVLLSQEMGAYVFVRCVCVFHKKHWYKFNGRFNNWVFDPKGEMMRAKDFDFYMRYGGIGFTFYPYQIAFGFSLRYWPCVFAPAFRIHFLCFKLSGYIKIKKNLNRIYFNEKT